MLEVGREEEGESLSVSERGRESMFDRYERGGDIFMNINEGGHRIFSIPLAMEIPHQLLWWWLSSLLFLLLRVDCCRCGCC